MILDELLEFVDAVDVSAAAGSALVGDVIDLGATPQDFGSGQPMYCYITVDVAFASAGAATVQFKLMSDATATITPASASEHWASAAISKDALVAGYELMFPVPMGVGIPYERYLGLVVVTAVATTTAGTISSGLTYDQKKWVSYADAVN